MKMTLAFYLVSAVSRRCSGQYVNVFGTNCKRKFTFSFSLSGNVLYISNSVYSYISHRRSRRFWVVCETETSFMEAIWVFYRKQTMRNVMGRLNDTYFVLGIVWIFYTCKVIYTNQTIPVTGLKSLTIWLVWTRQQTSRPKRTLLSSFDNFFLYFLKEKILIEVVL